LNAVDGRYQHGVPASKARAAPSSWHGASTRSDYQNWGKSHPDAPVHSLEGKGLVELNATSDHHNKVTVRLCPSWRNGATDDPQTGRCPAERAFHEHALMYELVQGELSERTYSLATIALD
jgi:hypothetical protein